NTQRALHLAQVLERENKYRKEIDTHTLEEALELTESTFDPLRDKALVLAKENWHSGVIGIVASRLIERFYRPTVMITIENGIGKGSARSIPGFDIYNALDEVSDLLEQFGGHTYAAGLSVKGDRIEEFRDRLNDIAVRQLSDDDLIPKLRIDAEIDLKDVNGTLLSALKMFAPFGQDNPMPVFMSHNVQLADYPRVVGHNHLKFQVKSNGRSIDCIGFNLGDLIRRLDPMRPNNHIVYTVEENDWGGQIYLQLRIRDVKNGNL
ncbi:single-stranded-DNA-specific exonuclease RecJ, partial [bacterium]|nr:single-stranded-DNA-specific exonuclease RecJ [bacterium]